MTVRHFERPDGFME